MAGSSAAFLGVFLAFLVGCSKATPVPAPSSSATSPGAPRVVVAAQLSSPSAFELLAVPGGLKLIWAESKAAPNWLFEAELAQDGSLRGAARARNVAARSLGKTTDLAAAYVGDQLALAWVEQGEKEARAQATWLVAEAPGVLLDLGAAALSAESARGNIALVAEPEQGRALALWRGLGAPCVDPQASQCVGFTFRRLRPGGAETTGLPLSVPVPCASHSVELSVSAGRFQYGVCTREGTEPVTTMFSIQYAPEYARAEPLLKGCLPLGTVDVHGVPWLIGDCHGKRKAVPVPMADEKVQADYIDAPQMSCTPEHAELRQGRFALSLREPRANLQAVLPSAWVPSGARAGWTGKSLVVVYVAGGRLETRTFACQAGKLQQL